MKNIKGLILLLHLMVSCNFFTGCSPKQPVKKDNAYIEILFTDFYFRTRNKRLSFTHTIPAKIISHSTTDTLFFAIKRKYQAESSPRSYLITALNKEDTVKMEMIYRPMTKDLYALYPLDTLDMLLGYDLYDLSEFSGSAEDLAGGKIEYLVDTLDYQKINKPVPKVVCTKAPSLNIYFQDFYFYKYPTHH